jgi:branched-chain amino acid transport system permease protein
VSDGLALLRRHSRIAELIGTFLVAAVAVAWVAGDAYKQDLVLLTATYCYVALGIYVPFIMNGGLSLAYNAYLGLGAYAVAMIASRTSLSVWLAIPAGMAASALTAIVLGYATRKLTGFYLAAVTLLFGQAYETFLIDASGFTGGAAGIGGLPLPAIFGVTMNRTAIVILAVLGVWVVGTLLASLRRSPFGITVRAQKEVATAVAATGVRTAGVAIASLAAGAAIAAFGGSIFAMANQSIFPESLTLDIVFLAVFMPLLGGQRSPWGTVIGAALVSYFTFGLQQIATSIGFAGLAQTGTLVFALAVLAVLLVAPNGVLGLFGALGRRITGTPRP